MSLAKTSDPLEIVVFDFDGTITTRDTFALFLRYYAGTAKWAANLLRLLPIFIAYVLRLKDRNAVKAKVIRRFFQNAPRAALNAKAQKFAQDVIPGLIRPQARIELEKWQKTAPDSLYICSASIGPYLHAWGKTNNINNILCTELEEQNEAYTGKIKGYNIWGEGKIRRIEEEFAPNRVVIKEAYGDSRGDCEMLHAAQVSNWQPFRLYAHE